MTWLHRLPLAAAVLVGLLGCRAESPAPAAPPAPPPPSETPPVAPPAAAPDPAATPDGRKTTSEAIARRTRDAQRAALAAKLEARPGDLDSIDALITLELDAARFFGDMSAYPRLDALVAALPGDDPEAARSRARVDSALHRFAAAGEALVSTGDRADSRRARALLQVATGDAAAALPGLRATAEARPTFEDLSALATALAATGDHDGADRTWRAAAEAYRGVSPFVVAWLSFARGVMWAEQAGRPDRGRALYEDAVARLPSYVTAQVHLAEMQAEAGDRAAAIARLEPLDGPHVDPELTGYLGELYLEAGRAEEGRAAIERARARYGDLLSRYPAAFADHGAEFYMGPGADPKRALELARVNRAARSTPRARMLLIEAALAAGDRAAACAEAEAVGDTHHVGLREAIAAAKCPPG